MPREGVDEKMSFQVLLLEVWPEIGQRLAPHTNHRPWQVSKSSQFCFWNKTEGWGDGSVVQRVYHSCRSPKFHSQHPSKVVAHNPQSSVMPALRYQCPLLASSGTCIHVHTPASRPMCTHDLKTKIYLLKIQITVKQSTLWEEDHEVKWES